jgi:hypothetical protein
MVIYTHLMYLTEVVNEYGVVFSLSAFFQLIPLACTGVVSETFWLDWDLLDSTLDTLSSSFVGETLIHCC